MTKVKRATDSTSITEAADDEVRAALERAVAESATLDEPVEELDEEPEDPTGLTADEKREYFEGTELDTPVASTQEFQELQEHVVSQSVELAGLATQVTTLVSALTEFATRNLGQVVDGSSTAISNAKEIQALIEVRNYINVMINNYNREKSELVDLRAMLILIDNKIVALLLSSEFKEYINFADAKKAITKAAEINNIKSGLKKPTT